MIVLRSAGALIGVCLFFLLLIELLARATWNLSGTERTSAEKAEPTRPPVRWHRVEEWPTARGRNFHEAPMLAERVKVGKLPSVAERLPLEPQVVIPPEQTGPYGGTWRRYGTELSDIQTYVVHRIPYPNMLRWDPSAKKLLPNIVTRWKIEDNARCYTFWLRRGIRWSDGQPFTTDDIMFWYQHVLQNKDLTPSIAREYKRGGELMTVEKIDDFTIRFRFKEPNGLFLTNMAEMPGYEMIDLAAHYFKRFHPDFVPVAQLNEQARKHGFDFWYQWFGQLRDWPNPDAPRLWPWIVTQPPPARVMVLERNPYYWKVDSQGNQLPYIDRITFEIYDPETINLKAINGEIGMQARHIKFENYPLFMENRRKGHYRVLKWIDSNGGTNNLAVNMNSKDPVKRRLFGDKRFRIALSLAINRDEINQACFFGLGTPRQCAPPSSSPYYDEQYARAYTEYNPQQANRLLDELGLTRRNADGIRLRPDGKPLTLQIDCLPMACNMSAIELVADDWTAVGIKSEVNVLARQLFYQRKKALMHDVNVWFGADEQNPLLDPRWFFPWKDESNFAIAYAAWFRSNGKKGQIPPPEIRQCMDLYRQIEVTRDPVEQRRLFMQIINLNRQNLWVIGTIGQAPVLYIVSDTFRNVPDVAISGWQFRGPANTAPECYAIEQGGR
ncbi:MAG TPA: ABC transporter substrate-binding protein [Armatimonadota bacterium]|nr:ABC transporter substrate-binding protein [Armatimonadota bacterium]